MHHPVWLYHKKQAPNGQLFDHSTNDEIKDLQSKGWKDAPFGDEPVDPPKTPTGLQTNEVTPNVVRFDDLSNGEIIIAIDDMSRSEVEAQIEARSINRGEAATTGELRAVLAMAIRPEIADELKNADPLPPIHRGVEPPTPPGPTNLAEMEPEARAAAIDTMTEAQIDETLEAVDVQLHHNTGIEKKRLAVKAYFDAE